MAFSDMINEYRFLILKVCRMYARDEANFQDLFQEVVIQLWKSYKSFQGRSKFSTWIYRVALNTCISATKLKKRRIQTTPLEVYHIGQVQDEYDHETDVQIKKLHQAIKQLKETDRGIITLYLEEKSYEEIAEIIGITVNNVGVKINRIKSRLFKLLTETKAKK